MPFFCKGFPRFCLVFMLFFCLFLVRRVPPRFSIPPTDNEIMPGGSVNITCVAVGSPMPYVKWMMGAEDLTPEDDMPIGRNVLELTDVRQSANYTCVAMSTLGVIEAAAQITVKGTCAFNSSSNTVIKDCNFHRNANARVKGINSSVLRVCIYFKIQYASSLQLIFVSNLSEQRLLAVL